MSSYEKIHEDEEASGPPSPNSTINIDKSHLEPASQECKSFPSLRRLIWVEFAFALIMILIESIIVGLMFHYGFDGMQTTGMGIWVGILAVITASLGFVAFRTQYGNKGLMIAYFILSIFCALGDAVVIIFATTCFGKLNGYMNSGGWYPPPTEMIRLARGLMAMESLLLLAAATHLISTIVSTAFMCGNLCYRGEPLTVVVCPPGTDPSFGSSGNEYTSEPFRVVVPPGTRMTTPTVPPQ